MTVDNFIKENIEEMKRVCRAYMKDGFICDDLVQESIVILLEKRKDKKLNEIIAKGDGMYFYTATVKRMVVGTNSKFHKQFLKPITIDKSRYYMSVQEMDETTAKRLQLIDEYISTQRPYSRIIWKLHFNDAYSFSKLADETGISRKTLYNDIDKLKAKIEAHLRQHE